MYAWWAFWILLRSTSPASSDICLPPRKWMHYPSCSFSGVGSARGSQQLATGCDSRIPSSGKGRSELCSSDLLQLIVTDVLGGCRVACHLEASLRTDHSGWWTSLENIECSPSESLE